jgi:hypothetical protein
MPDMQRSSSPTDVLKALETVEANLAKVERIAQRLRTLRGNQAKTPDSPEYERLRETLDDLVKQLPAIDGWRLPQPTRRIDELTEYRIRFDRKRRALIRPTALELIAKVDRLLAAVDADELETLEGDDRSEPIDERLLEGLREAVAQVETLLGSSVQEPRRWSDLLRHLHFGLLCDLHDIIAMDWPEVRSGLESALYGEDDPLPVEIDDLGELAAPGRNEPIPTGLEWERLKAEDFERLIFALLSSAPGYEKVEWLTATTAPDRGRDVSASRVITDSLGHTRHERVIVQCKHWQGRSIGMTELVTLKEQMKLWEPPRVDVLIIATSGRFSTDCVNSIERQNASDSALRIEPWPENHLERLLAKRPALIAEFGLR